MTTTPTLKIPKWVPPAAGETILQWWNRAASTPEQLAVLHRLAKRVMCGKNCRQLQPVVKEKS
jgi:hypothetical protein